MSLTIPKNVGIRAASYTGLATQIKVVTLIESENTSTLRFEAIGIDEWALVKTRARSHYPKFHGSSGVPAIYCGQLGKCESVLPHKILFLTTSNSKSFARRIPFHSHSIISVFSKRNYATPRLRLFLQGLREPVKTGRCVLRATSEIVVANFKLIVQKVVTRIHCDIDAWAWSWRVRVIGHNPQVNYEFLTATAINCDDALRVYPAQFNQPILSPQRIAFGLAGIIFASTLSDYVGLCLWFF